MAKVVVNKRRYTPEEVVQVAVHNYPLEIEQKAVDGDAKSAAPATSAAAPAAGIAAATTLSAIDARAVVFARLCSLVQQQQLLHSKAVSGLADSLNQRRALVLPAAASDDAVLEALSVQVTTDAFAKDQIRCGLSASAGIGSIAVYAAATCLDLADVTAALSCEAYGAFTDPFSADEIDQMRPHASVMQVASNLRSLLQASKQVNNATKHAGLNPDCFRCIPQLHAPARDQLALATKAVRVELNAVTSTAVQRGGNNDHVGPFHAHPLAAVFDSLIASVQAIAEASRSRVALIAGGVAPPVSNATAGVAKLASVLAEGMPSFWIHNLVHFSCQFVVAWFQVLRKHFSYSRPSLICTCSYSPSSSVPIPCWSG